MKAKDASESTTKSKIRIFKGDRPLWIVVAILSVISLLVIYSSTASMAYREVNGDTSFYLRSHSWKLAVGLGLAFFVHLLNPSFILKGVKLYLYASLAMTVLAYTPWFSATINGASRWFQFPGVGFTVLPSDPLKVSLVLFLAVALGRRQEDIDRISILPSFKVSNWRQNRREQLDIMFCQTFPLVLPIIISVLAVLFANLSTAVIIFFISVTVLLVGRVRRSEVWRLITSLGISFLVIVFAMHLMGIGRAATWVGRMESYVSPIVGLVSEQEEKEHADDFQKTEAKVAIASGGITGKGPGKSTQRSTLPHPYSDFSYAFIIEEYGLFGGIIILTLYLWILYRAGVIVRTCEEPTHNIAVIGLTVVIITPAFVNMLVSTGVFPVTGQSLPILSLGGSSVIITSASFGVILSISRFSDKQARIKQAKEKRERELAAKEQIVATSAAESIELEQTQQPTEQTPIAPSTDSVPRGTNAEPQYESDDEVIFTVREDAEEETVNSDKEVFDLY